MRSKGCAGLAGVPALKNGDAGARLRDKHAGALPHSCMGAGAAEGASETLAAECGRAERHLAVRGMLIGTEISGQS